MVPFKSMESPMMIYKVTWLPGDHIEELATLLDDISVELLLSTLVNYVSSNVEPVGWTALWLSPGLPTFHLPKFQESVNFIVDVMNVSQEKLEALIILKSIEETQAVKNPELQIWFENIKQKEVNVPLQQLYVLSHQENPSLDMAMTAEVIEQVRFIYDNIWQPWDTYEEVFTYNIDLIRERMKIYQDITNEVISKHVATDMKKLLERARKVHIQINDIESQTEICTSSDIDQNDIVQLMKLNKEMEQLKSRYDILKDPSLRELVAHQEQLERSDMLKSLIIDGIADVLIVINSSDVQVLMQTISTLKQALKSLPNVPDTHKLQGFPSLQFALDSAKVGSTVILLPGCHVLTHLGALSNGGNICGLGEDITIRGSHDSGDILLDVSPKCGSSFLLQSVNIEPLSKQDAIYIHEGNAVINNCSFQGGRTGICVLGESNCEIRNCQFKDQSNFGLESRTNSRSVLQNITFDNCNGAAVKAESGSHVSFLDSVKIQNCKSGIHLTVSELSEKHDSADVNFKRNLVSKNVSGVDTVIFNATEEDFTYSIEKIE